MALHIPIDLAQQVMSRRDQRGEVRHLSACDEADYSQSATIAAGMLPPVTKPK